MEPNELVIYGVLESQEKAMIAGKDSPEGR